MIGWIPFRQILDDLPSEDLRLALLAQLFEEYVADQKNTESEPEGSITKEETV